MAVKDRLRWSDWIPLHKWRIGVIVDAADEVPERLPVRTAVLIGTVSSPKWIAFDCPCGRGHRILLNVDDSRSPQWSVRAASPLTVWPSIDAEHQFRRCHFILRNGKVTWVRDDDRNTQANFPWSAP